MGVRASNIILLCEDKQHERFARAFLTKWCSADLRRRIRLVPIPGGRGDAKQWICDQFPSEVKAYRAKANHLNTMLIVITDVDNRTLQQRVTSLDQSCRDCGVEVRRQDERIVFITPKWAIETWIMALNGQVLDENERIGAQKKKIAEPLNTAMAENLADQCKQGRTEVAFPPSLEIACLDFNESFLRYEYSPAASFPSGSYE